MWQSFNNKKITGKVTVQNPPFSSMKNLKKGKFEKENCKNIVWPKKFGKNGFLTWTKKNMF